MAQHLLYAQFHDPDSDPANSTAIAQYNARATALYYRKTKTPKEAQLPVNSKFKGMEELLIYITSKTQSEETRKELMKLYDYFMAEQEEEEKDPQEMLQKAKVLAELAKKLDEYYGDAIWMYYHLGTERYVLENPARINEKIEATANIALRSGKPMNQVYKENGWERLDRTALNERMDRMTASAANSTINSYTSGRGRGRGRRGRGPRYNKYGNGNNNNGNYNNQQVCYKEGVKGGGCEAYNKYGTWSTSRPNGCRFKHQMGRKTGKRNAEQAGIEDIE